MNIPLLNLKRQYKYLKNDIEKVISEILESGAYINGPYTKKLEERLKEYFNIKIDNGIEKGKVVINDRMYSRLDILRKEINESDSN